MRNGISKGLRAVLTAVFYSAASLGAMAETPEEAAREILKQMSEYLGGLKNLSLEFGSEIEVISHGGQTSLSGLKIQFISSGNVSISRPGKIRASRTGGETNLEIISNGKTATFHGRDAQAYAQAEAPDNLDELFEKIRLLTGVEFPGADLLFSDVYLQLYDPVERAAYIGLAVVDGIECHHLAFRTLDVDWQIWIDAGEKPVPRKYVITSKWVTGAPQYQLRITDWNDNPTFDANQFDFLAPAGATEVGIENLVGIGDLPIPAAIGGQ